MDPYESTSGPATQPIMGEGASARSPRWCANNEVGFLMPMAPSSLTPLCRQRTSWGIPSLGVLRASLIGKWEAYGRRGGSIRKPCLVREPMTIGG